MKIVIDTNVIASAIFFGGKPKLLLEKVFDKQIEAFVSREILIEYKDTVNYLCNKYPQKKATPPLSMIAAMMTIIEPETKVSVCRDPDDDKFIECAVDAKCMYIVSGDKDLLEVEKYDGMP